MFRIAFHRFCSITQDRGHHVRSIPGSSERPIKDFHVVLLVQTLPATQRHARSQGCPPPALCRWKARLKTTSDPLEHWSVERRW